MALIKCIECGGMISDKAKSCPHCGCPASVIRKESVQLPVCPQCGYIFHDGILHNCPICKLPYSQITQANEKLKGNHVNDTTDANSEHMINQAYSDDGIDWWYYVRRAIWLYTLLLFVLYYGASGDLDDFAQKYSQKHGYVYSDIRNFIEQETSFFPIPKTEYYFRDNYGKKEVIGSYSFWNYTIK